MTTQMARTIALSRCQYQSNACVRTLPDVEPVAIASFPGAVVDSSVTSVFISASQFAAHGSPRSEPFQPGDSGRRLDLLRSAFAARALGVTRMASGVARHGAQTFALLHVAHVIGERPGAIQRGG